MRVPLLDKLSQRTPKIDRAPKATPFADESTMIHLRTRQTVNNLLVTDDGEVFAGYRIGPQRHNFLALDRRRSTHSAIADGWASLTAPAGRAVHERVTSRPHPVNSWAKRLSARTPKPLADVHYCNTSEFTREELHIGKCGCETYAKWLERQQRRIAGTGMDDKVVFRYFGVGTVDPRTDVRAQVLNAFMGTEPSDEVKKVLNEERKVASAVAVRGWEAKRMTAREMKWIRLRSLAPGIPAPSLDDTSNGLEADQFRAELYDVRWIQDKATDRFTKVVAWRNGKPLTRYVQVLTVETANSMLWPENGLEPWQVYAERAREADGGAFAVEWMIGGKLYSGQDRAHDAVMDLRRARNVREGYTEHGEEPPPVIDRGIRRAKEAHDEKTTGKPADAARLLGSINVLVFAEDRYKDGKLVKTGEELVQERGEAFVRLMGSNEMQWKFVVPTAQHARLREFVPGEKLDTSGFQHEIPVKYLAAGMPNTTASIGDGHGPYKGYTQGAARRPVMHDSHYATEGRGTLGRKANFWICVATLGGGKSVMLQSEAYDCVRLGTMTVANDPAGRMGKLLTLPELKGAGIERNTALAENGENSPYAMLPHPRRDMYRKRDEHGNFVRNPETGKFITNSAAYESAKAEAYTNRAQLGRDMARTTLPADLYYNSQTQAILRAASRAHGPWEPEDSLFYLVDELRKLKEPLAKDIADSLMEASTAPYLRTLFAPRRQGGDFLIKPDTRYTLEIITTPGLKRAPEGTPRDEWTANQVAAESLLHMAALRTTNIAYNKPRGERVTVLFDEADNLTSSPAGRTATVALGRNHSGDNMEVILASQDLAGVMAGDIRNFLAGGWIGQMKNREHAEELLTLFNVEDKGYAETLLNLSRTEPGEFMHADADGNVEVMKFDIIDERLANAIFSNPENEGAAGWTAEEELA